MTSNRYRFSFLLVLVLLVTTACASHYRKRDEAAAQKIKTAAVIAFIVKEPASNHISTNLNTGKTGAALGGSSFYQMSPSTDEMYKDFVAALEKSTGWKVLTHAQVASNPIYIEERKKMMAPIQVMFLPEEGQNWSMARDIMVPKAAETGGRQVRTKVLNALGVDAVVVAEVTVSVKGGFSLNGLGPRRPRSEFDMQIYERDNANAIWIEGAEGAKSEESLGWVGFIDEGRLRELSRKSARDAYTRIGAEIK